jgi:hypothetical protein
MEKQTLKRLGRQLRKEIVPLEDLPYPMREALRKLAEKYDQPEPRGSDNDNRSRASESGRPNQPSCSSLCKH